MDKIKSIIEMCDIAVKIGHCSRSVLLRGQGAPKLPAAEGAARELQRGQVENLKLQAEHSKIQAEQAKIQAEATSTLAKVQRDHRQDDAALVQMIVELLFKQNLQCRTEDQMVLISFLGEMNDSYNKVKLGDRVAGAFGKRRECALMNEAVKQDASVVQSSNGGRDCRSDPGKRDWHSRAVAPERRIQSTRWGMSSSKYQAAGAIGYVALGNPVGANQFRQLQPARWHPLGKPRHHARWQPAASHERGVRREPTAAARTTGITRSWDRSPTTNASRPSIRSPIPAGKPGPW